MLRGTRPINMPSKSINQSFSVSFEAMNESVTSPHASFLIGNWNVIISFVTRSTKKGKWA